MKTPEMLLSEREAAEFLRLAVPTMRNWRCAKRGPAYLKLGARAVRYRFSDLQAFVAAGERDASAQP